MFFCACKTGCHQVEGEGREGGTFMGDMIFEMKWVGIGLVCFVFSGCCASPWLKFPNSQMPDMQYRTGASQGYDVYVWECQNGKRTAVYKHSGLFACDEPEQEVRPCGDLTEIEKKVFHEGRFEVPSCFTWRALDNESAEKVRTQAVKQ